MARSDLCKSERERERERERAFSFCFFRGKDLTESERKRTQSQSIAVNFGWSVEKRQMRWLLHGHLRELKRTKTRREKGNKKNATVKLPSMRVLMVKNKDLIG